MDSHTEADDVLNANRNVARDDAAPVVDTPSASRAAAPLTVTPTKAFDWRALWPWALAALVLVLIVWLLTRKGRPAPVVA
jgi:hypothetical protein